MKKITFNRAGRIGSYTVVVSAIVLALLVLLNVCISLLPSKYTALDTSQSKMYTLSQTTEEYLPTLTESVTLNYICQGGEEDDGFRTFLDRFSGLSGRISIRVIDPIADPDALEKYGSAAESLSNLSVIVESALRYKVIDYNEFYLYYNQYLGQALAYEEFNYYYQYYGSYMSQYETEQLFDGDNLITGAIAYVSADSIPKLYYLEGHGEAKLDTMLTSAIDYQGLMTDSLNLALDPANAKIPDDCNAVVIINPNSDLSSAEAELLRKYINGGGSVLLITSKAADKPNLLSLTSAYGLSAADGLVCEGETDNYYQQPYILLPTVSTSHEATSSLASQGAVPVVNNAHPITVTEVEDVTQTLLFTTGEKSYLKGDTDVKKSYTVAASAQKGDGKLLWLASSDMLSTSSAYASNYANYYYFLEMLSWSAGEYKSPLPSIESVTVTPPVLTVSISDANLWGTVFIIIVPLCILGGGFVCWIRRRRR